MKNFSTLMAITVLLGISLPVNAATLIGHWDFEEGTGTTALDSSGNHLNGVISNATYTSGRIGNYALDLNGSNSYVEVANNMLLNFESIAISLWFKPRNTQVMYADILDKGHGVTTDPYYSGYVFQYPDSGGNFGVCYGNSTDFPSIETSGDYRDDTWHHIVANLGAAGMGLYVDNNLIASGPGQGPIVANDSSLYFGRHRPYLERFFNGLIDDVRIYDGPLTSNEVATLYAPEPATLSLLILGGMALLRQRKA